MPRHKAKAPLVLIPDTYKVLSDAVALGVVLGWTRAHKHTDTPTPEAIQAKIHDAVLDECAEWFHFPDPFANRE